MTDRPETGRPETGRPETGRNGARPPGRRPSRRMRERAEEMADLLDHAAPAVRARNRRRAAGLPAAVVALGALTVGGVGVALGLDHRPTGTQIEVPDSPPSPQEQAPGPPDPGSPTGPAGPGSGSAATSSAPASATGDGGDEDAGDEQTVQQADLVNEQSRSPVRPGATAGEPGRPAASPTKARPRRGSVNTGPTGSSTPRPTTRKAPSSAASTTTRKAGPGGRGASTSDRSSGSVPTRASSRTLGDRPDRSEGRASSSSGAPAGDDE